MGQQYSTLNTTTPAFPSPPHPTAKHCYDYISLLYFAPSQWDICEGAEVPYPAIRESMRFCLFVSLFLSVDSHFLDLFSQNNSTIQVHASC
jgi:hypothetical protein